MSILMADQAQVQKSFKSNPNHSKVGKLPRSNPYW